MQDVLWHFFQRSLFAEPKHSKEVIPVMIVGAINVVMVPLFYTFRFGMLYATGVVVGIFCDTLTISL